MKLIASLVILTTAIASASHEASAQSIDIDMTAKLKSGDTKSASSVTVAGQAGKIRSLRTEESTTAEERMDSFSMEEFIEVLSQLRNIYHGQNTVVHPPTSVASVPAEDTVIAAIRPLFRNELAEDISALRAENQPADDVAHMSVDVKATYDPLLPVLKRKPVDNSVLPSTGRKNIKRPADDESFYPDHKRNYPADGSPSYSRKQKHQKTSGR